MQVSLSTLSCMSLWNDFSYSKEFKPHVRAGAYIYPVLHCNPNPYLEFKWAGVTLMQDLKGSLTQGKQTCCTTPKLWDCPDTFASQVWDSEDNHGTITQITCCVFNLLVLFDLPQPQHITTHFKLWLFLVVSLLAATPASPSELWTEKNSYQQLQPTVRSPLNLGPGQAILTIPHFSAHLSLLFSPGKPRATSFVVSHQLVPQSPQY